MPDVLTRLVTRRDQHDTTRSISWPWAAASLALLAVVAVALLLAQTLPAASVRPTVVAAPAPAPMNVIAVAHPESGAALFALDTGVGHLVALAAPRELECQPAKACPAAPAPDAFVVLDGQSGQLLASAALTGDAAGAANAEALLVDSGPHLAYVVAPGGVTVFSTQSASRVTGFALPSDLSGHLSAALAGGMLYVTNGAQLVALHADSGQVAARMSLSGRSAGTVIDGPLVDSARTRVYLLLRGATAQGAPTLLALDAHDLHQAGQYTLPAGARLGPLDASGAHLYAFGPDGTTWQLPLDALASSPDGQAPLTVVPSLHNALAFGENPTLGHQYIVDASGARILTASGTLASLPLPLRSVASSALLVDDTRSLVYLPADHGAIVIVRDNPGEQRPPTLSAASAILLARAAFAATWHDAEPADGPAFASVAMFPVSSGTRPQEFWLVSPNGGWLGPYAGNAITAVVPPPHASGYLVIFTLRWNQLFPHQHVWAWAVSPDGGVRLSDEFGDSVP